MLSCSLSHIAARQSWDDGLHIGHWEASASAHCILVYLRMEGSIVSASDEICFFKLEAWGFILPMLMWVSAQKAGSARISAP